MYKSSVHMTQNGLMFSKSRMEKAILKYYKIYNRYCTYLWDCGYLKNPSLFIPEEFWDAFDSYCTPQNLALLVNEFTGAACKDYLQVKYASIVSDDKEFKEVTTALYKLLEAKQALEDLGIICSRMSNFKKRTDTSVMKLCVSYGSRIRYSIKFPVNSKYIIDSLYIPEGKKVKEVNFGVMRINRLLSGFLGVNKIVKEDDESVFIGHGLTVKEEAEFFDLLVTGSIIGDTPYGKMLYKKLESYYTDFYGNNNTVTDITPLNEQLFLNDSKSCCAMADEARAGLGDFEELYFTDKAVYFLVDGEMEEEDKVDWIPVSCTEHETNAVFNAYNRLRGVGGEFISTYEVTEKGYETVGLPIKLYFVGTRNKLTYDYYFPLCMVKKPYGDTFVPVYPTGLTTADSVFHDSTKALKMCGINNFSEIEDEVFKCLVCSYDPYTCEYRHLIGKYLHILVCIWAGVESYGDDGEIGAFLLDSAYECLPDDAVESARLEAQSLYYKLGF